MDTAKEYDIDVIQPSVRLSAAVFAFSVLHNCIPSFVSAVTRQLICRPWGTLLSWFISIDRGHRPGLPAIRPGGERVQPFR